MPAKIYYDQDADLGLLKGKKIAIIGYGSQGHAHALNLKDSGQDVIVGLYQGSKSWPKAEKDGLKVAPVADAAKAGDVVMILLPDQTQRSVFEESIRKGLGKGKMLMFAHGFNIHFNQVVPPPDVDVTMIAPKAPGHVMRDLFTQGPGVPALVAVQQDVSGKARDVALAYGRGGLVDGHHLDAVLLGLRPALRSLVEANHDVLARVLQVQRVRVSLASVADDGDLLAAQEAEVRVLIVENLGRHDVSLPLFH